METHHIDPNRASKLCVQIRVENHRLTTLAYGMEDLGGFKVSRVPSWFQFSKFDISTPKDALQETHLPWPSASAFCTHSWCGPMMRGRKQLPATLSSPGMHGSSSPHWDIWKLSAWHSGGFRKFQLGIDPQWPPSVSVNIQTYLVACTVFLHHSPNAGKRFCPWSQDRTK